MRAASMTRNLLCHNTLDLWKEVLPLVQKHLHVSWREFLALWQQLCSNNSRIFNCVQSELFSFFYLNTIDIIIRHEVQIQYLQMVKGLSRWA